MLSSSPLFSVVIPTYNERENVREVIRKVLAQPTPLDILVVDDNSPDGTGDMAAEIARNEPRLNLLRRKGKLGLGTAYIEGFRHALARGYGYVFEMDADLSHDPNEIPNFMAAIKEADLVIGSRYITGVNVVNWPLSRLLLSYFASVYTRIMTGIPIRDTTSGFKCFRREVLESVNLNAIHSGGYAFQVEMNWQVWMEGFRLREIPITFVDRTVGRSKMSKSIVREAVRVVLKLSWAGLLRRPKSRASR
jgi:dolichol-phosphate mannosyltransferase